MDVIESFKDSVSIEEADITIRSESREYHKRSTVQYGIGSIMGLYMVTSGCPIMDKLRPMVYTHLPFSSLEETLYRAASMYLFAQYFRQQEGKVPDWEFRDFTTIYEDIATVNQSFTKRLLSINPRDASLNALVGLDCFASVAAFSTIEENLKEFEALFGAYLRRGDTCALHARKKNRPCDHNFRVHLSPVQSTAPPSSAILNSHTSQMFTACRSEAIASGRFGTNSCAT